MNRLASACRLTSPVLWGLVTCSCLAQNPVYTDPAHTDEDFPVQGEYLGSLNNGEPLQLGVQLVALGSGQFRAVPFLGGLPGDGWDGERREASVARRTSSGQITFQGEGGTATYRDGRLHVQSGQAAGILAKVTRQSPTLGAAPPPGAVVLFDGSSVDQWRNGKMSDDGLLMQGTTSKPRFQSHRLHIEFRLPYQPQARGQARGNSGIYLQGRYEVQMLDSFGLEGADNECGGIYRISSPAVNMCYPPLSWQTYDIDFVAARFDDRGQVTRLPRITVRHNGVLIQDGVQLPDSTTAAPGKPGPEPGPVYLQDHGNPVRYRNIWVVPTDS
jgi:hypothetical protein